jgi:hypothetical protein
MGLDTYRWLARDLLATPFRAQRGAVDAAEISKASRGIRADLLMPVQTFDKP